MLKFRPTGLTEKEYHMFADFQVKDYYGDNIEECIRLGTLNKKEINDYYNKTLKSLNTESNFLVYDLGHQGVYVIESWIQPPEDYINDAGNECEMYQKHVSEYYIDYKENKIHSDVKKWDILDYEKTEKRLLVERHRIIGRNYSIEDNIIEAMFGMG